MLCRPSRTVDTQSGNFSADLAQPSWPARTVTRGFPAHLLDLHPQPLVLLHFDLEESHRKTSLLFHTSRSQQIHIRSLVIAVLKVGGLDPPLSNQRP